MSKTELSYQLYSEFKNSDWYIYWDRSYSKSKDLQLLVVWNACTDTCIYYDYIRLKEILKKNELNTTLPYLSKITDKSFDYFKSICEEFINDVNVEFDT